MNGWVDLHAHWLPAVDDGVRTLEEGIDLVRRLRAVGFEFLVATPHLRPGMFDNQAVTLRASFEGLRRDLAERGDTADLAELSLAGEHFFDDVTFSRLLRGEGLPYGKGRTVLVEFFTESLPVGIASRFFELRQKRLRPVVAHPERYVPVIDDPRKVSEQLRRAGGVLLLDLCALTGKYGGRAQRTAEALLDLGAYYAACTDAHRPADVDESARAIARLIERCGRPAAEQLLGQGPRDILEGRVIDEFD